MPQRISQRISLSKARFARREDGSIALETAIILPVVFIVIMSLYTIFDAFRQYALHQKAAYTITDMLARETFSINDDFIDGAHALFNTLTREAQDSSIRMSVLRFDLTANRVFVDWSETRGTGAIALNDAAVATWRDRLPNMVNGERMVVVETWADYTPLFRTGLERRELANFIFSRPRYAPQIRFDNGVVAVTQAAFVTQPRA